MPRYFFNIFYDRTEVDSVGEELPDKHAAWKEATVTAGQLLQSLDGKLQPDQDWRMEVTDEFASAITRCYLSRRKSQPPVTRCIPLRRAFADGYYRAGTGPRAIPSP